MPYLIPARPLTSPKIPISMTPRSVLHDASVFPDPHSFRPERWLDCTDEEQKKAMNKAFVPFGRGTRMCIGTK